MKIKSFLFISAAVVACGSTAFAADAVQYQEPIPAASTPSFTWNGAYLGGQIGYGWSKSNLDGINLDWHLKPKGFLGGIYAGYNYDLGDRVILGVDADVTFNRQKDDYSERLAFFPGISQTDFESKLRWSGAVRARAGYAFDRFLPYIAGGVAFGSVKNTYSRSMYFGDQLSSNETRSQSKTLTGWTIGAGVDYAATDNVIVRFEYRYTDYGRKNYDFGTPFETRNKFKTNDIRLGVAYKF